VGDSPLDLFVNVKSSQAPRLSLVSTISFIMLVNRFIDGVAREIQIMYYLFGTRTLAVDFYENIRGMIELRRGTYRTN